MFRYRFAGLILDSSLPLPSLIPAQNSSAPADITLHQSALPDHLEQPTHEGALYQVAGGELLYDLPRIVRFWVRHGREIVFQPAPDIDTDSVRAFLLTTALAAAFHQRRTFIVQGAAVEIDGEAAILSGASGTGKSSLAAILYQRGYRVLTDDFSPIQFDESGQALVMPTYPSLHLWHATLQAIGCTDEQIKELPPIRPSIRKFRFPMERPFELTPIPVRAIYLMATPVSDYPPVMRLPPLDALANLNWQIYYQRLALDLDLMPTYWQTTTRLIERVRIARLLRVFPSFDFDPLVKHLLEDFRG
jgi:hypothetical protein